MNTEIKYKEIDGTFYHAETSNEIISILENARFTFGQRLIIDYGDTQTGKSWNEKHNIEGYIRRSTGVQKIPLLIYNNRCFGGNALLDHCIVKITTSKGKVVLYQHPNYSNQ